MAYIIVVQPAALSGATSGTPTGMDFASCNVTLRRALGSNLERANPQKPQSALQMFVMAN